MVSGNIDLSSVPSAEVRVVVVAVAVAVSLVERTVLISKGLSQPSDTNDRSMVDWVASFSKVFSGIVSFKLDRLVVLLSLVLL